MIKVYVNDYCLGLVRDLVCADAAVVGYAYWLSESERGIASFVVPYRYLDDGARVVCDGEVAISRGENRD